MSNTITIPSVIYKESMGHLFQNDLEQGVFLFAEEACGERGCNLQVVDAYMVPPDAWEIQEDVFLQMKDQARAGIMSMAKKRNLCAIDCHSHPHATNDVWFSPSDVAGITEFAKYAHWKLDNKPFAAIVFGECSADAVLWKAGDCRPELTDYIVISGGKSKLIKPTDSWYKQPRGYNRFMSYEY